MHSYSHMNDASGTLLKSLPLQRQQQQQRVGVRGLPLTVRRTIVGGVAVVVVVAPPALVAASTSRRSRACPWRVPHPALMVVVVVVVVSSSPLYTVTSHCSMTMMGVGVEVALVGASEAALALVVLVVAEVGV